ncbi:MAG: hypothetical protein QW043_02170 [Desulfurococcaceae archaeon]
MMNSLTLTYVVSLTALATVLKLRSFEVPYPPAPFLKYDISGIPLALIGFISLKYTPISLMVYFVLHLLMGADPIGMAMKCVAEASTFTPLALIRRKADSKKTSILAVSCAVISRILVMAAMNYAITPYWLLWARWAKTLEDAYAKTLALMPHIAVFNATLALIVAPLSLLIYGVLKRAGFLR